MPPALVAAMAAWTIARQTVSAPAAKMVLSCSGRGAPVLNAAGSPSVVGDRAFAGGEREHDVAVDVLVDRVDRPGQAVLAGDRHAGALVFVKRGVGGDHGERRVERTDGRRVGVVGGDVLAARRPDVGELVAEPAADPEQLAAAHVEHVAAGVERDEGGDGDPARRARRSPSRSRP